MCGIAGEINFHENYRSGDSVFAAMRDLLKRRGPNQEGIYYCENSTLVHTRLAVIDPEHGIQPMTLVFGSREYCMVYNGELYNTEELRSRLIERGHQFTGHSDTEVLLKCYVEWGERCLSRINGIFAFAVWENHNRRLFFARDRMGVKPFFYSGAENVFVFGSEIKALLAHPLVSSRIDSGSIAEIMLLGPGRTPGNGVFTDVKELCAGHCGYYSHGGLTIHKYWDLCDSEFTDSFDETAEKVRALVVDSIERQLVSDVPLCTFLSGGLDSSIISAVAANRLKKEGRQLPTFSVDYKENDLYFKKSHYQPDCDSEYISCMQKHLASSHSTVTLDTDDLVTALYSAVDARDLPGMGDVDASLLLFCKKVKEYSTVALSGECADEVFGGYPWYRDESLRNIRGFPWTQSADYRCGFLKDEILDGINADEFINRRYLNTIEKTSKLPGLSPLESRMKEMMKLNIEWFMQTLLDRKDRMSMYSGLEVRVPFCDHRIVEYLYTVPWEIKNYGNREKGLLRAAVKGLLPDEVLRRPKSPYPKTHHPLYLKKVSLLLEEVINNTDSPLLRLVKKAELEKLLYSKNSKPWYGQLMTVPQTIAYFLQVNYWLQKYHVRIY